jgi:hypothetical protein
MATHGAPQQPERMRRIGVLMNVAADDPQSPALVAAFMQGLRQSGWTDGRNARIDYRWAAGDAENFRRYAKELVSLSPDVLLALPPRVWARCVRRPGRCRSFSRVAQGSVRDEISSHVCDAR